MLADVVVSVFREKLQHQLHGRTVMTTRTNSSYWKDHLRLEFSRIVSDEGQLSRITETTKTMPVL
jgi:hypothetical protein